MSETPPAAPEPDEDGLEAMRLTVHGMPGPERDAQAAHGDRGRLTMLLILALCALPVALSYFTYYVVRPQGRANYAALIEPQRPLPGPDALPALGLDGRPASLAALKGQWLLVAVAPAGCGPACERQLFMQRQLREMMGAERDRVDKVWLVDSEGPVAPALAAALAATPQVAVLRVRRDALARWLEPAPGRALEDHLYIVDPFGHWMMRAPADADPAKLKRDLDRLLRASAWWDRPKTPPMSGPNPARYATPAYDWRAAPGLALIALAIVSCLLMAAWWRGSLRRRGRSRRIAALAGLTLFLCFDLVCFGAYTRLSDSGLGCPDWPGCYATASPVAAARPIARAEAAAPDGPVTARKAWIEMIHRYFATALGALILLLLGAAARAGDRRALGWAALTFAWVIVQGAFGALTVTWKLYPAIVTAHLLGGMGLLALLALQAPAPAAGAAPRAGDRWALALAALALVLQIALGGWVSTNYAVLACTGFPQCNGQWWPAMRWEEGFTLARELGRRADGAPIAMSALVAIQWTHRLFALALTAALAWLALRWRRRGAATRRRGSWILAILAAQWLTGLSNVVLGWPMAAALAHTAGAAALAVCLGREAAAFLNPRKSPAPP
jgi:cytochrome c oxidase assembly protein subunit 15